MKTKLINYIAQHPIIPVFYHDDLEICQEIMKACYAGGIRVFEFVNRGQNAQANFKALLAYKERNFPELKLGIGTILKAQQAEEFLQLGAEFLVSPIVNKSIAKVAEDKQTLWIPGCMTPTEIATAEELGCTFIKLFPGDTLGPGYLKSIRPLFSDIKFMPTGGVDVSEDNIQSWFSAGVMAVGLGSKLFTKTADQYDYAQITQACAALLKWAHKTS